MACAQLGVAGRGRHCQSVQGAGRVEHLLPFRPPFNESAALYADPRLLTILYDFLGEHVKLELMTVINSPPGSGDQRWHQGWRYLFHPEERLPPYAVVVTLPLTDVSIEMGPTEICPGKKLRLYHGWRCNQYMVKMATTQGTMSIFDYKTLHRGPGNVAAVAAFVIVNYGLLMILFRFEEATLEMRETGLLDGRDLIKAEATLPRTLGDRLWRGFITPAAPYAIRFMGVVVAHTKTAEGNAVLNFVYKSPISAS